MSPKFTKKRQRRQYGRDEDADQEEHNEDDNNDNDENNIMGSYGVIRFRFFVIACRIREDMVHLGLFAGGGLSAEPINLALFFRNMRGYFYSNSIIEVLCL